MLKSDMYCTLLYDCVSLACTAGVLGVLILIVCGIISYDMDVFVKFACMRTISIFAWRRIYS